MKTTFITLLKSIFGVVVILLVNATTTVAQSYAGRMGVEAASDVFVNMVNQSYRWDKTDGAGGWVSPTASDVDADGWPKTDARWILDNRPVTEWFGTIDDPDSYRINYSGTYKGSFTGQATLTGIEGPFTITNQVYNVATNTTTFDLTIPAPGPGHGLVVMSFTNTKRTATSTAGTGISGFKLIRPGYAANTTQVFTNAFISTLTNAKFSVVRYMGVANINNNIEYNGAVTAFQPWSNRKKPTDAAQTGIDPLNKKDGWCYEYIIDACNQANMDLWLNIPVAVDNNYITELAKLVKTRLNPNLRVYLEHANEVWNFGFTQYSWNKNRASEESSLPGFNLNYDGSTDVEIWGQRRHARRLKEAVDIFAGQFGTTEINNRIRGVLAGVTPDPNGFFISGRLAGMLKYLSDNYGPPKNYIYTTAIPLYYGGDAAAGKPGTESFTVAQILDAMRASSDADVTNRRAAITLASTTYQLPGGHSSYEGGPDLGAGEGLTTNLANRIRAVRDVAHKDVYKRNFATNFWDLGGNIAMQFTLASPYNRYGAWGLTDDINVPDRNFLFAAVRELIGAGGTTPPTLRNPENPANAVNGLDYAYYQGDWNALPDFNSLTSVKTGTVTSLDLTPRNQNDNFAFKYTGYINVPTDGTYTFYLTSDDGSQMHIGSTLVVDHDGLHGATEKQGTAIGLKAGKHALKVSFFEKTGGEALSMSYEGPGITKTAVPASAFYRVGSNAPTGTGLLAEYFDNKTLTAPSALTRTDATVNNDWGSGSPATGTINVDNFSVRWTGQVLAPVTGTYSFSTVSDDGVRLWVNNVQIVNNWTDHGPVTDNGSQTFSFTAGQKYDVKMEFYEAGGGAVAKLQWAYPGQATQIAIPQSQLFPASGSIGGTGTDVTLTFEGAATGTFTGNYTESGYKLFESASDSYIIYGTGNSYQSKVYHPNNWNHITTLARTDNGPFDLKSFAYATGVFNGGGDATVTGYKSDGSTVTQTYSFSSKTQSTLTLNWTSLTRVEINFGDGTNQAYGALDNFAVVTRSSARLSAESLTDLSDWTAFPNPTTEILNVRFSAAANQRVRYSLFNGAGQQLFARGYTTSDGENTLNMSVENLPAGVYLIRLEKDGKSSTKRIAVVK